MGIEQILEHWYPGDCHPLDVDPVGGGGGLSGATFWKLTTPRGVLCFRRWPAAHPSTDRLSWIHQTLRFIASRCPFQLPEPIETTTGSSFVDSDGHLWELTRWLDGDPAPRAPVDLDRIAAAMEALAQLHDALDEFGVNVDRSQRPPTAPRGLLKREPILAEEIRLRTQMFEPQKFPPRSAASSSAPLQVAVGELAQALATAWDPIANNVAQELQGALNLCVPSQVCIRDIWRPHVFYRGSAVTAVIDFGALDVDCVAADLSRLLGSMAAASAPAWQVGLQSYASRRPLSLEDRKLIVTYDRSGVLLSAVNWLHWLNREERRFSDLAVVTSRILEVTERVRALAATPDDHPAAI